MKLKPKTVKIDQGGKVIEIPLNQVKKDDKVIVELGERIAVDGVVVSGEATLDQSSLTGESLPVAKKVGDNVLSFTTVTSGHLIIQAQKVGTETTFEKIINLVEQAQLNKAPIYTLINKFANWYIILTLGGAAIVYLISCDVTLVLSLLLVSCADDIAIATPLAMMTATTHSARHGAIIKGGDFLEGLAKIKTIIFDKTGTLTQGKLKVDQIVSFNAENEQAVIKLAAVAASSSSHPVAHAIVIYAKDKNIAFSESDDFNERGGEGIEAAYQGKKVVLGKLSYFEALGIKIDPGQLAVIKQAMGNGNVTLVGYDNKLVGFIGLVDKLRPKIKQTIAELKVLGVNKTVMLTGDNQRIAKLVAEEVGVDEFHANLLPADKLAYLQKALNKKYKVAMVGDGVNDAPVLALADIGIAMGAIGSDASIEAADIALMKDDLSQLPELIKIGRSTMNVIRQNLTMWGILNILGFSLVFLHVLNPAGAAAYNFISDFIPILNSLRLFR